MALGQKAYKSAQDRLSTYLKEHALRPSKVRSLVLVHVFKLPQPFTAEQLVEVCTEEHISVGTVYNALEVFVLARILHAVERQRGRSAMEYEVITGSATRMQVVCQKCGRMTEFHDQAISRLVQDRIYSNFDMQHFTLLVYGECKICRRLVTRRKKGTRERK